MTEHQHTWTGVVHTDGCHAYNWGYACLCGATRRAGGERDFSKEGLASVMWFEESCERCQELLDGAEPKSWDEVTEAT